MVGLRKRFNQKCVSKLLAGSVDGAWGSQRKNGKLQSSKGDPLRTCFLAFGQQGSPDMVAKKLQMNGFPVYIVRV